MVPGTVSYSGGAVVQARHFLERMEPEQPQRQAVRVCA